MYVYIYIIISLYVCLSVSQETDRQTQREREREREFVLFKSSKIHILFSAHGTFARIDHMLSHKASLGKFKKVESYQASFLTTAL